VNVPNRRREGHTGSNNGPVIHRDPGWIFAGSIAFVIFVLTMRRGVVG